MTKSWVPERRALTRADLDSMPEDGHRYELVDGSLIVTPAPSLRHQAAVSELMAILMSACPADLNVLAALTDVALAEDTVLQPDVLVLERRAISDNIRDFKPLLVVEVLSPSTRHIDLTLKKSRYEAAATPNYWVVDADEPSITAWTLTDGAYGEPTVALGFEVLQVSAPFAVTISPSQLTI